jgi:cytochrome d ubiquinol oxidase subunit I
MNSPAGFKYQNGQVSDVRPIVAMLNPATPSETLHTLVTAYLATGIALAGITAITMLRGRRGRYYRQGLNLSMLTSLAMAILAVVTGDMSGKYIAAYQPAKLAAVEAIYHTQASAPEDLILFKIPNLASFLATGNPHATLQGLDAFALAERPPIMIHYAFLGMVGIGMFLSALTVAYALAFWRRRAWTTHPRMLWLIALATPLGFLAIEFGWMVTELGRQPWIIYHLMTVSQALTLSPYVPAMFWTFLPLYIAILFLTFWALWRWFRTHPLPVPTPRPTPTPAQGPAPAQEIVEV